MARKIVKYFTVVEATANDLDSEVNMMLHQGWELYGGIVPDSKVYIQCMVKYDEEQYDKTNVCSSF